MPASKRAKARKVRPSTSVRGREGNRIVIIATLLIVIIASLLIVVILAILLIVIITIKGNFNVNLSYLEVT